MEKSSNYAIKRSRILGRRRRGILISWMLCFLLAPSSWKTLDFCCYLRHADFENSASVTILALLTPFCMVLGMFKWHLIHILRQKLFSTINFHFPGVTTNWGGWKPFKSWLGSRFRCQLQIVLVHRSLLELLTQKKDIKSWEKNSAAAQGKVVLSSIKMPYSHRKDRTYYWQSQFLCLCLD